MSKKDYTKFSNKPEEKIEPVVVEEVMEEVVEEVKPADPMTIGVVVDCVKLNVREAPSSKAPVVCVVNASMNLMIFESESTEDFYKVCTESGAEGFCMKKFIEIIL